MALEYKSAEATLEVVASGMRPVDGRWEYTVAVIQKDSGRRERQFLVWLVAPAPERRFQVVRVRQLR
jgi:hypothetical protein